MPRTPKRLTGPAVLSAAAATKYTVPALTKTIIRHIHLQNPSASPVNVTMSIGADAAGTRILDAFSVPAAGAGVDRNVVDIFCYYVMEVGEILVAFAGTASIVTLTVSGDEMTLGL